jgi:hypothetical protein
MISSGDESDETCIHDRKLIFQTWLLGMHDY